MALKNYSLALLAICSFFLGGAVFGQGKANPDPNMVSAGPATLALSGQVILSECNDPWDIVLKTTQKLPPAPGTNLEWEERQRWKAEANAARDAATPPAQKTASGPAPVQGANFIGNQRNGSDPADNGIAVGPDGTVVSVMNTRISVYDSTGTLLFSTTLNSFDASLPNVSNFTFDPRVAYDIEQNRWVICYLTSTLPSNTKVIVGFSQTSDPLQGWNIYALNGNPFNDGTFTDYPAMGLSTDELFITGNSFSGASSFESGTLWQIDKMDGYNGDPLDFQVYTNPYFSLLPVQGAETLYGPRFFLVRHNSASATNNNIFLHEVTNSVANGGVVNSPLTFAAPVPYSFPGDASQSGSSIELLINDFRFQQAYLENDQIHFVLNSSFGGLPGIYYGVLSLNLTFLTFSGIDATGITYPGYHLAYPAIAYAGEVDNSGRNKSFITFNFAGPTHFPGHGALYWDGGASDMLVLKGANNFMNPPQRRWGDYTDVVERPGKPGEVWAGGTFSNTGFQQQTWISQITPPLPVATDQAIVTAEEMEIYPNPSTERVTFRFPVTESGPYTLYIRDMNGRTIEAFDGFGLWSGEATLSFNTTALAEGVYTVSVESGDGSAFSKLLTVQR